MLRADSIFLQLPWYTTASVLKRIAVSLSVLFSMVGLIVGAFGSTGYCPPMPTPIPGAPPLPYRVCDLTIVSIAFNGAAMALSAITGLDWEFYETKKQKFGELLEVVGHYHEENGKVVIDDVAADENNSART